MTITENDYFRIRSELLLHEQATIINLERKYTDFLCSTILSSANDIYADFCQVTELRPFWANYPPLPRGHKPRGTSLPWGDLGEKAVGGNIIRAIVQKMPSVTFPGLPLGGDVRFATEEAIIHFDLKLTGPTDNPNEIVASPHQISGDGCIWIGEGVANSPVRVVGKRAEMAFQPELPPFYVLNNKVLLCLTYFLKAVYTVIDLGNQPLDYLEVICVPNGLLLFDGPKYAQTTGLLIPGKDDQTVTKKRTRVRLDPLANLAPWRCIKIVQKNGTWQMVPRATNTATQLRLSE